jgi:hypothetical protein
MFDSMAAGRAGGDGNTMPILPATPEVSIGSGCADDETGSIPKWGEAAPGPEMMAALAAVPLAASTDDELLDVLAGWERATAWLEAQKMRALARTSSRLLETATREDQDLNGSISWNAVYRQVETEISTALHWTSRTTLNRLDVAKQLTERLPQVLDAMTAGQLGYRHAEVICDETDTLTDRQARRLVDKLLPEVSTKTVIQVRNRLRKACLQLDPATANEKALQAVSERSVTIRPLRDGLALLEAIGPADAVLGMFRVLNDAADRHEKGDPRTQTARRFDALTTFVLAGASRTGTDLPQPKIPALVQITMDLDTLLGLRDNPAELHGYGPLPAVLARALAVDADWQRFIKDPLTGLPADLGRTQRHPNAELRRWLIARDQTCQFPACYRPATRCEPDHNPAWDDGGKTNKDTLTSLCRKHHKVRHHGWHYQRHPDRITWTSPHDQVYERYYTEADLIGPDDSCPHIDDAPDDTIWLLTNEDQRRSIFMPKVTPGRYVEEIPWEVVQAFRLEDQDIDVWPCDANGVLLDEYIPTPEEEQAILDAEDRAIYGDPDPVYPENSIDRIIQDLARIKLAHQLLPPDAPPPF